MDILLRKLVKTAENMVKLAANTLMPGIAFLYLFCKTPHTVLKQYIDKSLFAVKVAVNGACPDVCFFAIIGMVVASKPRSAKRTSEASMILLYLLSCSIYFDLRKVGMNIHSANVYAIQF